MNRRMKLIFTVSVLLNIVFVGVAAGMFYKFCQDVRIPADMSPEARSFVARTYQNGREDVKPLITEVKARKKKVESTILADSFDAKAYNDAVDDLLETQQKIMRHRANTMEKALVELSTQDRKKFSKEILDGLTPGKPKKSHHYKKGDYKKDGERAGEEKKD